MSLIFITGISGVGRSAVLAELRVRGIKAYGVDEDGYADWVDRKSGKIKIADYYDKDFSIHKWYKEHEWTLSEQRIKELANSAESEDIYLCGVAAGFEQCRSSFEKVIALHIQAPETLKARIINRKNNNFGKDQDEMKIILDWHRNSKQHYEAMNARVINADQPVGNVVNDILVS